MPCPTSSGNSTGLGGGQPGSRFKKLPGDYNEQTSSGLPADP